MHILFIIIVLALFPLVSIIKIDGLQTVEGFFIGTSQLKRIIILVILLAMILIGRMRFRLFDFSSFRFGRELLPAIVLISIYLLLKIDGKDLSHDFTLVAPVLGSALLATFIEELAFRFVIPWNLSKLGVSIGRICVISALLFSLVHFMNLRSQHYDVFSVINQLVFAFFMGMLLFSLYYLTRSFLFVWLFHFLTNLPGKLGSLTPVAEEEVAAAVSTTTMEEIISSALYILLMSPLIIVSIYYLRKIRENDRVDLESGRVGNNLFDT